MKLLLDSNVVIDYLAMREPYFDSAFKLFMLGKLGEMELWISTAQANDVIYILSNGGKPSLSEKLKRDLRKFREGVRLCSLSEADFDAAIDSAWLDIEDAYVYQCALKIKADAIITRNKKDFERSSISVFDCDDLFLYLQQEKGFEYSFIDW